MERTPQDSLNYKLIGEIDSLKKGTQQPTVDIKTFRETLLTYGIVHKVLFTKRNPHYAAVWETSRVVNRWKRLTRIAILIQEHLYWLQWWFMEDQFFHFA